MAVESKGGDAASKGAVLASWNADIRAGKYNSAITKLDKILADRKLTDEQKAMAYINRGLSHQKLELYRKAVADYSSALTLQAMSNKTRAIVVYNRGIAYQKLKRQARAIDDFTNALYLDVEFAHAYYGRARLMHELGRYELALGDFSKAMKYRHPDQHLPFYGQALAFQATQQHAKARKALSRALLLKPNFKPALDKYQEIAGVAFNPKKLVLPATKVKLVDVPESDGSKLPEPTPPPAELVKAPGSAQVAEADNTVTGSIPANVKTALVATGDDLKLPYRYPGMSGSTMPTPRKKPGKKPLDLRAEAEPKKTTKPTAEKTASAGLADAAQTAKDEKARKRALRVATLGKNAELAAVRMAKIAPDPIKTSVEQATAPAVQKEKKAATAKPAASGSSSEVAVRSDVTGWLVQLNSVRSEDAAKAVWEKYKKKYGSAFAQTSPVIQKADLGDKGIYYRLRLSGYDDKTDAKSKCTQLKDKGLSCYVVKAG
ncbi:MAG: SPOR domain-containing protein [Pseudomonadota bacterium]